MDRLVKLLGALFRRPRSGDRPRELDEVNGDWAELPDRRQRPGRKGLPMVCLVRQPCHAGLLGAVRGLLEEAQPGGVRHAYVVFDDDTAGPSPAAGPLETADVLLIRDRLREARNKLINSPRVKDGRLRFQLFTLVAWLTDQELGADDPDRERTLLAMIQAVGINQRFRSALNVADAELASVSVPWRLPLWLARLATAVTFRVAVTGRVPVISGQYRWFMRQRYLAPELSGSFVRFAGRLTAAELGHESAEDAARLLVNAFLEDLRRAYRLRPWNPWRQRRMTYPVLLLDSITMTNGGYTLLRVINDVRNEAGVFDPLLVISASQAVPPDAGRAPGRPHYPAKHSLLAYRAWQNQLLADRRARVDNAWYLPVAIPGVPAESERQQAQQALQAFNGYEARRRAARPPWWATRLIRIGVPVLVAVALAAGFTVRAAGSRAKERDFLDSHCGTTDVWLTSQFGGCVGVSDGSYDLFQPHDQDTPLVVQKIRTQNTAAAHEHRASPHARPYITLVYVAALTAPPGESGDLTTEREALEGIAVKQEEENNPTNLSGPLVRILIANAGQDMEYGTWLAGELQQMAAQDPSVMGVVGLDKSKQYTRETVGKLASEGFLMVAATLSADNMTKISPMYFQVAPQNYQEATVAAAFAEHLVETGKPKSRVVHIYYSSDPDDSYSSNLEEDAYSAFRKNFTVTRVSYSPNDVGAGVQDVCTMGDGIAYFAGRGLDFGNFLDVAEGCSGAAKPTIIGDDDTTTFVANTALSTPHKILPYYYESFASSPTAADASTAASSFYSALDQMFTFERPPSAAGRSYDGHAALAFDAVSAITAAATSLTVIEGHYPVPMTSGVLWREITTIHGSDSIPGASGTIDFGGDVSTGAPVDKEILILHVTKGIVDAEPAAFCGKSGITGQPQWCPQDG